MYRIIIMIFVLIGFNHSIAFSTEQKSEKTIKISAAKEDSEPWVEGNELNKHLVYPEEARKKGIEGKVEVKVFVDKKGNVKKCEVIKTDNKLLNEAAITAIKKTKFQPGTKKGKPIDASVIIPIKFRLK